MRSPRAKAFSRGNQAKNGLGEHPFGRGLLKENYNFLIVAVAFRCDLERRREGPFLLGDTGRSPEMGPSSLPFSS